MKRKNGSIKKTGVTAVVPVLNESRNLSFFLPKLKEYVDEIIIVDGRSTDDTVNKALKIVPDAKILVQDKKGKGDALKLGFMYASNDFIVMIDADCSHRPSEIPRFVNALKKGFDVVKGSRLMRYGGSDDLSTFRLFGNILFVILTNLLHGTSYTDLCYGFKAFRRDALRKVTINADDFDIETEMAIRMHRAGLKITEVPSFEQKRKFGRTKLSATQHGVKIFWTIIKEFILRYNLFFLRERGFFEKDRDLG
ncbi:MAG: glycosyltransferase family 2 protein [Candidatus Hodarchaeota archaeon]